MSLLVLCQCVGNLNFCSKTMKIILKSLEPARPLPPALLAKSSVFTILFLLLFSTQSAASGNTKATAQSTETVIINKVLQAYGGDTLLNAKNVKIKDYNKGIWPGESESPDTPEVWRIHEELTIDLESNKKSLLSYRVPRTTLDLEKWVHDGKSTIMYDIFHEKYSIENWADFEWLGSSLERSSDTMQARKLVTHLNSSEYLADEYYRGKVHHKLAVTMRDNKEFIYFVDEENGLISKVSRKLRSGEMLYVFSNHRKNGTLTYAKDMNLFVNGDLRLMSVERDFQINVKIDKEFEGFDNFTAWGKTFDRSKMKAKKVADGVYQAGKGRAMTVFVEQADFYIALGDASALRNNYEAITSYSAPDKPVKYFVVTHHQNANLRGLANAIELGAQLVVSAAHKETVLDSIEQAIDESELLLVNDGSAFILGGLKLFDIATAHSQHYLLGYVAAEKLIIAEDHFVTDLATDKPRVYKDMVRFRKAVDELQISVDKFLDIRGWRDISRREFNQWTDSFKGVACPKGYEICADG